MKASHLFTAFHLTAAACMLPVLVLVGMESLAQPPLTATGRVLDRVELHALENIARRAESMMEVSNVVPTRV